MSNEILSVVAYNSEVMGDLSSNPRFHGFAHIQNSLAVWSQKESGVRYPILSLCGLASVEGGWIALIEVNLGELFQIHEQDANGNIKARHAKDAVYLSRDSLSATTVSSLDFLAQHCAEWVGDDISCTDPGVQQLLSDAGVSLTRWIIKDKDGVDTKQRHAAITLGSKKGICIISCEESMMEREVNGFSSRWGLCSFAISGDVRFKLAGIGGSSTVDAIAATGYDLSELAPAAPVVAPVATPPAPAAQARSRFIRA